MDEYFNELLQNFDEAVRNIRFHNMDYCVLERNVRNIEEHCRILHILILSVALNELQNLLVTLYSHFQNLYVEYENKMNILTDEDNNGFSRYICPVVRNGFVGRPKLDITSNQVEFLRSSGLNWTNISQALNISRRTLYRLRHSLAIIEPQSVLCDEELDIIINDILTITPNIGEVYLIGALRARNVKIPRWRVRERLLLLDPIGRVLRKRKTIKRRIYKVKGSNYLW